VEPRSKHPSRRQFLGEAAATAAAGIALPAFVPASALGRQGRTGANDRIRLGIIGCGSMGAENLGNCVGFDDVEVTALCDVWKARREGFRERFAPQARLYQDHQQMLADDVVDAVLIASPPHWHALHAIDCFEAGKDVYLQKPMTLHVDETLAVRNAARKHGRIVQIGTQIHAGENYRRVVETLRSGYLGPVTVVRTLNVMNQGPEGIGQTPDSAPPEGLDWEKWVGPAPMRAFNETIVRDAYYHGSFWDYSGGWTPGMAPHLVDLPVWALELGFPTSTSCSGGRYVIHDIGDVPDVQEISWSYPGMVMTWSLSLVNSFCFDFGRDTRGRRIGIYFHGVNGTLFTDYAKHEIAAEGDFLAETPPPVETIPPSPGHEREWLDCVRSRQQPSCNPDYHARIDMAINLANLSYRLGRSLRFDPASERIVGDAEAVKAARPVYRAPYRFPEKYLSAT